MASTRHTLLAFSMPACAKNHSGFTLIELMIVIAIISIIAAFAVPSYQNSMMKSRRSDARVALQEGAVFQERHFAQFKTYLTNEDRDKLLTNPDGQSSPEGHYIITIETPEGCDVTINGTTRYECFTLVATTTGQQTEDAECDRFTINHLGQKDSFDAAGNDEDARDYACW